jgi:hypothetical protein
MRAPRGGGVKLMNPVVRGLPSDTALAAALASQCARAWNRAYELEDNRRQGEWSKYFAAVAEAEAIDEQLARFPAESPIGLRIKYVIAVSRLDQALPAISSGSCCAVAPAGIHPWHRKSQALLRGPREDPGGVIPE